MIQMASEAREKLMKMMIQIKASSMAKEGTRPSSIPAMAPRVLGKSTAKLAIHRGKLIQ